ncbi:hypothetical protein Cadr_000022533 [Camelus dromedarius]|uniref:Uncharacterized protein n=1 Tax=Camelus dromedarius TaxID=9838 RepID=A0A5N4CG60_CAMDR|nr:hypothetical protein Cadr_000022533 [Camelus dromedarius]
MRGAMERGTDDGAPPVVGCLTSGERRSQDAEESWISLLDALLPDVLQCSIVAIMSFQLRIRNKRGLG